MSSKKKESWFQGVKQEFKNVRWPSKKDMYKYSTATLVFIIFFGIFFYLIQLLMYYIKIA